MRLLILTLLLIYPSNLFAQESTTDPIDAVLEEFQENAQEAQEEEKAPDTSVRFAPDFCDFEITFPEAPYTARRCPEGANGKCYQLTSYTMVYDLATTVEVSVTCVPSSEQKFERYSERVMRAALQGMVKRAKIEDYNINYSETDAYKYASLNGGGGSGRQSKIYSAQLWSGHNSVFTLEAKLTGRENKEADTEFSEILKTMHVKENDTNKETKE